MSDNTTQTEKLILYMDQELPEAEKAALEQQLAADATLQAELENLRLAKMAITREGLRQDVAMIHVEMMKNPREVAVTRSFTTRLLYGTLRVAVSLVFVALTIVVYQYFAVSSDKLYKQQFQAFSIPVSRGSVAMNPVEEAYRRGDYTTAINRYKEVAVVGPVEHFYVAQSYLAVNDIAGAIGNFEAVLRQDKEQGISAYQDEAEYYLALAYLNNKEPHKALPLFRHIYDDDTHLYHDKINEWFLIKLRLLKLKS